MTIKRQWILVLVIAAILSVVINSVILSSLINRYFVNYSTENYKKHLSQITEFSRQAILKNNYSKQQLAMELETQMSDPITRIRLYDAAGNILADVDYNAGNMMNSMMKNKMMNRMMSSITEETDSVQISNAGVSIGKLTVTRYDSIRNSIGTKMFNAALIGNSIFSFAIVLIFVLIIGVFLGRKMSKDLADTAELATNIDLGNEMDVKLSHVREIRIIQQSLKTLKSRLKLKQTSRKKLIDELVHQSRTPLTILKTHLEGVEDGIISMSSDEIKICEDQIDNLAVIITNMSRMIDAGNDIDSIKVEEFELNQLIRQIIGGLKVQFDKKQIALFVTSNQRVNLETDKYKLSQCIYNLLTNAYKFTDSNGKVQVGYKKADEEIMITIQDSGTGISVEDKKHLFDAYFRGTNSNNISGEGIGLYVVKENLRKIDGTISVESELGKGSKFIIKIPCKISSIQA